MHAAARLDFSTNRTTSVQMAAWISCETGAEALLCAASSAQSCHGTIIDHVRRFIDSVCSIVSDIADRARHAASKSGMGAGGGGGRITFSDAPGVCMKALALTLELSPMDAHVTASVDFLFMQQMSLLILVPDPEAEHGSLLHGAAFKIGTNAQSLQSFAQAQAHALAVSAPALKLILPLSAGFQVNRGMQPLLLRASAKSLGSAALSCSSLHAGSSCREAESLALCVANGAKAWLLTMAQSQQEAEDLEACVDVLSGAGQGSAVLGSDNHSAHPTALPCAIIFTTWVVMLQMASQYRQDWDGETFKRLYLSMERAVLRAGGGSRAYMARAIRACLRGVMESTYRSNVVKVLSNFSGFSGLLLSLLEADQKADKRGHRVVQLLEVVHSGDASSLLTALSGWLKPESNCTVDVRLQAISGI